MYTHVTLAPIQLGGLGYTDYSATTKGTSSSGCVVPCMIMVRTNMVTMLLMKSHIYGIFIVVHFYKLSDHKIFKLVAQK